MLGCFRVQSQIGLGRVQCINIDDVGVLTNHNLTWGCFFSLQNRRVVTQEIREILLSRIQTEDTLAKQKRTRSYGFISTKE